MKNLWATTFRLRINLSTFCENNKLEFLFGKNVLFEVYAYEIRLTWNISHHRALMQNIRSLCHDQELEYVLLTCKYAIMWILCIEHPCKHWYLFVNKDFEIENWNVFRILLGWPQGLIIWIRRRHRLWCCRSYSRHGIYCFCNEENPCIEREGKARLWHDGYWPSTWSTTLIYRRPIILNSLSYAESQYATLKYLSLIWNIDICR